MKGWSLRRKIISWTVAIVALAALALCVTALVMAAEEDREQLDDFLSKEVAIIYEELKRFDRPEFAGKPLRTLGMSWAHQRLQVRRDGAVIFESKKAAGIFPATVSPGSRDLTVAGKALRVRVALKDGWTIVIAMPYPSPSSAQELLVAFAIAAPILVLIAIFGGRWLAHRALAPVEEVAAAAQRISAGLPGERLPLPPGGDELPRLTEVLNGMIDRLHSSLAQARRFSADASHELRTPLTMMGMALEDALLHPKSPAQQQDLLLGLLDDCTRMGDITQKLLLLSRADAGRLELDLRPCDLTALLHEILDETTIAGEGQGIQVQITSPEPLPIAADAGLVAQVFRNLASNAVKHNHTGGSVRVEALEAPEGIRVRFANTGPGLTAEQAAHVFDRFYRVEAGRSSPGLGLGLSLAREIARAHGGDIVLTASDPEWTTFELTLPRTPIPEPQGVSTARS